MWERLSLYFTQCGLYEKPDRRRHIEGILWRVKYGTPWRQVPSVFGNWSTVYSLFNTLSRKGILDNILPWFHDELDLEWASLDGTNSKVHQHAAMKGTDEELAVGRSKGGKNTKTHAYVDAHGNPIKLVVTPGTTHDSKVYP